MHGRGYAEMGEAQEFRGHTLLAACSRLLRLRHAQQRLSCTPRKYQHWTAGSVASGPLMPAVSCVLLARAGERASKNPHQSSARSQRAGLRAHDTICPLNRPPAWLMAP